MIRQYQRGTDKLIVLGKTGFGSGPDGMTLGELEALVDEAITSGMPKESTRICTNMRRGWRGVISLFLVDSKVVKVRGKRG